MPTIERAGCSLFYEIEGDGPAIVFAHGAGGNHLSWWQQVPVFRDSYRCVTIDQRGFGRSVVDEGGAAPTPDAFADDLLALLDELAIDKAALVAQSMGGWTCLGLALRHPQRVAALVMADTLGGVSNDVIEAARRPGRERLQESGLGRLAYSPRLRDDRPEMAFLYDEISGLNRPLSEILPGGLPNEIDPGRLASLETPLLWVVGSEDPLVPPAAVQEGHRLTPGSQYFEVAETGHSVYFERAAQFNARLRTFLDGLSWD